MASIRQHPESDFYYASFRFGGRQFTKSLRTKQRRLANAHRARIEETIRLLKAGRIQMPAGTDPGTFILSDGLVKEKQELPERVTLGSMFEFYRNTLPQGAKEENTLKGETRHCEHLERIIGRGRLATELTTKVVQEYVVKRAKEKWNKRIISPQTIKKELTTLRLIWNWCKDRGLVTGQTPTRGVVLPKTPEKPRFMTIAEINRTIERGGVTDDEQRLLWESLFLQQTEVTELLEYVKKNAKFRFVYPMFVFVAHTGVRRSEMVRSKIDDLNFENGVLLVREKKKSRVRSVTFRHVEMSPLFESVMKEWLADHPGGQQTICFTEEVQGRRGEPLTNDASNHHFNHVLKKSKWEVVKGFHTFRHSFASNLALGIRQKKCEEDIATCFQNKGEQPSWHPLAKLKLLLSSDSGLGKGIGIIAPMIGKKKDEAETGEGTKTLFGFKVVHVFDISQTDGEELPQFAQSNGEPGQYHERLESLVRDRGIDLIYVAPDGGADGVSKHGEIHIRPDLPSCEKFSVLAHEFAHEILHHGNRRNVTTKTIRETEAEAVAYVVCQAIGIETTTRSSDYIQLYCGNDDTLVESLDYIQKTASTILDGIMQDQHQEDEAVS